MFSVQTYLKNECVIKSLEELDINPSLYFNCFNSNDCLSYIYDYNHIEGAIIVYYNQQSLLDYKHWDIVDMLWVYFLDAIYSVLIKKENYEFYFPDQALKVSFNRISDLLLKLSIDENVYCLDLKEFIKSIVSGAEKFFSILINCDCSSLVTMSKEQLDRIEQIRAVL